MDEKKYKGYECMMNFSDDPGRKARFFNIIQAALEYFIAILISGAYLARLTSALGFSDSLTGILSSFVSLGCLFQLTSIHLFRNIKSVKRIVISMVTVKQLLFALVYLIPIFDIPSYAKTIVFIVFYCASYIISNLMASQKSSWMISFVPDRTRGMFTAKMEIVSLIGGMIFTFAAGNTVDALENAGNVRMVFIVGSISIFVLTLLHMLSLFQISDVSLKKGDVSMSFKSLMRDGMFVRIVMVGVLWSVASHAASPFYGAYQIKDLGFSMTFISVLSIVYSVVRVLVSPMLGRFADRTSFASMVSVCFAIAAAGFLVNCFAVPENGKVLYTIYNCLSAISMGGINSSISNLIYDHVKGEGRASALAISSAMSGVVGFLTTCLMSPIVSAIQNNGNRLFGIGMYHAQFVSFIAFVCTAFLVFYVRIFVVRAQRKLSDKA